MLSNLAETLQSQSKLEKKQIVKVSSSKNKDLVQQSGFQKVWKTLLFKKHFTAKITLILMIRKMPLIFLDVEKYSSYDLFYHCTSEALKQ